MYGLEVAKEYQVVRKRSVGLKGFEPLWEQTRPARLKMLEQIKGKSLDELEDLIGRFSQDLASDDIQDDSADDVGGDGVGRGARNDGKESGHPNQPRSANTGTSIAALARTSGDDINRESTFDDIVTTTVTVSSRSLFVPLING